jgi:hypothetical protein
MTRHLRCGALLLLLSAACSDSTAPVGRSVVPSTSSPTPAPVATVPTAAAPDFPALQRPGVVYAEVGAPYGDPASTQFHGGQLASRFVFYDDGRSGLQFSSPRFGFFEYGGSYARTDAQVAFVWDGWSTAGPWGATGTLRGDTLHVTYNLVMQLSDFVDGDYVRVRVAP